MSLAHSLADIVPEKWAVRAMLYAALTGLAGVLSGFALFSYLWFAAANAHPVRLIFGLLVAACMSFLFEWLREKIQAAGEHGHAHPPLTVGRWLTTVILLLVFEVFVVAWHSLPEREGTHFHQLAEAISGLPNAPPLVDLASLIVLWTMVGSMLTACLSLCICEESGSQLFRCSFGAVRGLLFGLIIPPLAMLVAVICVRFAVAISMLIFQPEAWNAHVDGLVQIMPRGTKLLFLPVIMINYVANLLGPLRPWVVLAAFGGFFYLYAQERNKGFWLNVFALAMVADKESRTQATNQLLMHCGELQTQLVNVRDTLLAAQQELDQPIAAIRSTRLGEQRISTPPRLRCSLRSQVCCPSRWHCVRSPAAVSKASGLP